MRCLIATFAVAVALPAQPAPTINERATSCLDRARPALRLHLERTAGGRLALACLAALHDQMEPDDPDFLRALKRLSISELDSTYDLSLRLMVAAECPWLPERDRVSKADCERLLSFQHRSGGFGYRGEPGWWDMSNTQYAALGLRASVALGYDVPQGAWERLIVAVQTLQLDRGRERGGVVYRPREVAPRPTESMTAAGLVVLQVARMHLEDPTPAYQRRIAAMQDRAWVWLGKRRERIGSTDVPNCMYFHNALERAAILSGRTELKRVDWYAAGVEMLEGMQGDGGGFYSDVEAFRREEDTAIGHPVDTAFAVLFLRRSFRRDLRPFTEAATYVVASLPEGATKEQIAQAVRVDGDRGADAFSGLQKALVDDLVIRRRAAITVVRQLAGKDFGYRATASQEDNLAAVTAIREWMKSFAKSR